MRGRVRRPLMIALATLVTIVSPGSATEFEVEPAGAPPSELPAEVGGVLSAEGVRVTGDGEPGLRVWLRSEALESGSGADGLGVAFGTLPEGALVGAVALDREWTDYKGQTVSAGLYTLRYLVAPADGAHTGVSYYRDFLLLVPAADDGGPDTAYADDELVAASRGATGTNHPAVMALFPVSGRASTDAGQAIFQNEMGQPTLALRFGDGDSTGKKPPALGLVVEGTGEL